MFPAQTRNVSFYNMLKVASRALKQVALYYLLVPVNLVYAGYERHFVHGNTLINVLPFQRFKKKMN